MNGGRQEKVSEYGRRRRKEGRKGGRREGKIY
jgi:hypothetical protein